MSYLLGLRIKELRAERGFSQEQVADYLGISRQRYARMENDQADLSYGNITKIAEFFGVKSADITSVQEEKKELSVLFREKTDDAVAMESVAKIEEILKVFYSHEKLYNRMKAQAGYEV